MDTASIRKISRAKYKNNPDVVKHIKMLQDQIAGYRMLAIKHKGTTLAKVSNLEANRIESALRGALNTKGE